MICLILANKTYETRSSEIRCVPRLDKHRYRCTYKTYDVCVEQLRQVSQ